jgi:hypothetical protein
MVSLLLGKFSLFGDPKKLGKISCKFGGRKKIGENHQTFEKG